VAGEIPACPERGGSSNLGYTPFNTCRGRTKARKGKRGHI